MTRYVALVPITAGSALAHSAGDPVPEANVLEQGYVVGEQVADADSAEGVEALQRMGILPGGAPDPNAPATTAAEAQGEGGDVDVTEGPFNPADHTVDEVNAWLDDNPGYAERVMKAEERGKHRSGIIHGPHGSSPDVAES